MNELKDKVALVIHSGSRNLGKQIAEYYQKRAYEELMELGTKINKQLAYLEGQGFNDYMNDMKIAQYYANLNRKAMLDEIITRMGWEVMDGFTTIHNYIDMDSMILRKGAISAKKGERVIIPINMRDGSIIAIGKGNPDWNYSGPHGAGRVLSRTQARKQLKVNEFQKTMKGVWSSSVNKNTLDESPMAYKPIDDILDYVGETVEINHIMKPLYNFKAN